jgi:hypothetical protein
MKHVDAKAFWDMVDRVDQSIRGKRVVIDIDMTEHTTVTEVSIAGRVIGEEISNHPSGHTRCYVSADMAAA